MNKRGGNKKKGADALSRGLASETNGAQIDSADPFTEIPDLINDIGFSLPIDQVPGPAKAGRAPAIMERPQAFDDSESGDEEESVKCSEDFNTLINQYQNEMRGKNQTFANRLPKSVNHLLGEANRLYLEKDFAHSIEVCYEAIKMYPENPEPYHLLSVIHEEKGDLARAADFCFIETHLDCKSDTHSWCRLADRFFKLQSYKNAGYCYGRALKCEKQNIGLLYKKAQCYDKLKDVRGAVKYYEKIYSIVPGQKEVVMKLGKLYSKVEQQHKAVWLMLELLARGGLTEAGVDFEVANVCCELMLGKKRFRECGVFVEVLGLNPQGLESLLNAYRFFTKAGDEEDHENGVFEKVFGEVQRRPPGHLAECDAEEDLQIIKDELPVEIIVKYSQSLLSYAKTFSESEQTTEPALTCVASALDVLKFCEEFDPTEYHNAFIDMIDLYFEFGYLEKSTQLCERLYASSSEADRPEILLRMGFLFGKSGNWQKEMEAYERVLKLNPENKKARFRLSEIYETNGLYQDAIRVLKQPSASRDLISQGLKRTESRRDKKEGGDLFPKLQLQKQKSDMTFGGDVDLEEEAMAHSEADQDQQHTSESDDAPSLGKRSSNYTMEYDGTGKEGMLKSC